MRHYSLKENEVLFGKDEWLDGAADEARLGTEVDRVHRLLGKALETDSPRPGSYAAVLTAQTRAIEAAIALCRRQAAG